MSPFALFAAAVSVASAQTGYDTNFQIEYFFGNLPDARAEALGRSGAALEGSTTTLFFNPATLGSIEHGDAVFSTSAPFYALGESDYYFLGAAYRVLPFWVVAVSWHRFAIGPTTFDITFGSNRYPVDAPTVDNTTLSSAIEPLPGLQIGANVHAFAWKYIDGIPAAWSAYADAGVLYSYGLPPLPAGEHELRGGASVQNTTASRITFFSPADEEGKEPFPIVLRVALAWAARLRASVPGAGEGPIEVLVTFEHQNTLNNAFGSVFRGGVEGVLWDVLALRLGGYTESLDDMGVSDVNYSRLNDVTYGFGIRVPLDQITDQRVPVRLRVDYTSLEPAPVSSRGGRLQNFRTVTFGAEWTPPERTKARKETSTPSSSPEQGL